MDTQRLATLLTRAADGLECYVRDEGKQSDDDVAAFASGAWLVCNAARLVLQGDSEAATVLLAFADGVLNVDKWRGEHGYDTKTIDGEGS